MSDSLLQIASPILPENMRTRLNAVYAQVPAVSCAGCDAPGSCCELTDAEYDDDFATMYPLYAVEYLNIIDYVRAHFDPKKQREFLNTVEERPRRCPFLTSEGGCSIHPARPLTCRTYGILNQVSQVNATAESAHNKVPWQWISSFLSTERYTVCPKTKLKEADKVDAHMKAMVSLEYERELIDMSDTLNWLDTDRRELFQQITKKTHPTRWTWGGFNALAQKPLKWVKHHFANLWKASFLGE